MEDDPEQRTGPSSSQTSTSARTTYLDISSSSAVLGETSQLSQGSQMDAATNSAVLKRKQILNLKAISCMFFMYVLYATIYLNFNLYNNIS